MLACHNQGYISKVETVDSTCYCDQRFWFNMRSFLSFYLFNYFFRCSRYSPWGGSRTRYRWCPNSIYDFCQISAIPSFCLLDIVATQTFSETLNLLPLELCPAPVFLVFLHMFVGPRMFLHVLFILQENLTIFFNLRTFCTKSPHSKLKSSRCRRWYQPLAQIQAFKDCVFFFIWITSTVKKSNAAAETHGSP